VSWVLGALAAAVLIYAIVLYNLLVRDRNRVATAWSDIDVQLKRRHDLLPKLVEAVRRYAAYEQATLESVTELRARSEQASGVPQIGALEGALGAGVRRLFALVEAYPDLKADAGFLDLQRNVSEVEQHIQYARRYYNGAVRALNTRIDSFPDLLVARGFGFHHADYFELDDPAEATVAGSL
jgi:LemA protein